MKKQWIKFLLQWSLYTWRKPEADIRIKRSSYLAFGGIPNIGNTIPLTLSIPHPNVSYLKFISTFFADPIMGCLGFPSAAKSKQATKTEFPKACSLSLYITDNFKIIASALWTYNFFLHIIRHFFFSSLFLPPSAVGHYNISHFTYSTKTNKIFVYFYTLP